MPPEAASSGGDLTRGSAWRKFLDESALLRHYLWKYRKFVGYGLATLLLVDLLELAPPIFLKNSIDAVMGGKPRRILAWFALAYVLTSLIQGFCRYGWRIYLIRSSMLAGRDLRLKFSDHLFQLSASFYDKRRIGELMSLATNDVDAVRMAMGAGLLTMADAAFYIVTVPVVMVILSPQLTLLAFLPLPLIPWFVMRNEREIHTRFQSVQASFSKISAMAQENLNGIRITKAFAREDEQHHRIQKLGEEYVRLNLELAKIQSAFGPTLDFMMSLGLVILLFMGGRFVISDLVTLGTFVAFQRYIQKMVWPMTAIGLSLSYYQRSVASSIRMEEVLSLQSDVQESLSPAELPPAAFRTSKAAHPGPWKTAGAIEFRKFHFGFPGSANPVLRNIDLKIEAGQRVAFVGSIGAGKTALLGVLPRLYPVGDGMVHLDGVDINQWPLEELRRQIGYVGQEVFLFSESVLENVAYGLHEWTDAPKKLLATHQAMTLASVREDVKLLSHGEQTRLGERGVNLSGGQKQRLTLARALAKEPSVLILDDALSSVDVQTEETILSGLRARSGRNTELLAAHRISTVKDSDWIVVLADGGIGRQGTHSQLITEKNSLYWKFHEQQRLKDDLAEYLRDLEGTFS
ncbi:MAG: ABC transporter ATP-binding protein [Methylotenera sp.]|nr:ABC transporter ATP-binding protein [Oligoflexia bacterium]